MVSVAWCGCYDRYCQSIQYGQRMELVKGDKLNCPFSLFIDIFEENFQLSGISVCFWGRVRAAHIGPLRSEIKAEEKQQSASTENI